MKPGDVATCQDCGATAIATWSSLERAWREGWPVGLTWSNGPYPRHEIATAGRPVERCIWCHERGLGYPSVMGRPVEGETWTVQGPLLTYVIPAIPGVKLPSPGAGEGPLNAGNPPIPPSADGSDGNKAPLERPDVPETWCTDFGDPVPAWVVEWTGKATAAGLIEKYGLHARLKRPRAPGTFPPAEPADPPARTDLDDGTVAPLPPAQLSLL